MTLHSTHVEQLELGGGRYRDVIAMRAIAYAWQGGLRRITNILGNSGDPNLPVGLSELVNFRVRDRLSGNAPVVHFGKGQSHVRFTPLNTANVNGQASGQSITFPGAWNGADLRLIIAGHKLQKDILLRTGHPRTFSFRLDDHSSNFDPVTLSTPDFRILNPILTHPSNPLGVPLVWQTSQQGGKWVLSCTLPNGDWAGWTLDPTLVLQPGAADGVDVWLNSDQPNTNYGTETWVAVGNLPPRGVGTYRGLFNFSLVSIPATAVISQASPFDVFLADAGSTYADNNRTLQAYPVLRTWLEAEATWNSYVTGQAWATAGCGNTTLDRQAAGIGSAAFATTDAQGSQHTFSLAAATMQAWVNGTLTNNGFILIADTEISDCYTPASSDHATAAWRPTLTVEYSEAASGRLYRPWRRAM